MDAKPRLDSALVQELVAKSHGDLDRVRALIQSTPALVNAAWDWGGIPLIAHAKAGGDGAAAVLAFLEERMRRSA